MERELLADIIGRFPTRLKELRLMAGLTQSELGLKCGLRQATIAEYESGKHAPTWANAVTIASVLGVTPDAFISQPEAES